MVGDLGVVKGVKMLSCPGHSPGPYSVATELDSHLMILTVDTTFTKENMEHKVPMGIHANPFQLVESMERLERLTLAEKGKRYDSHDMEEFNTYKKAPGYCE